MMCDWCCGGTPSTAYLVSGFSIDTGLEVFHNSEGAWAACALCAKMIDANRLDDLVGRAIRVGAPRGLPDQPAVREHYRRVFLHLLRWRTSDALPLDDPRLQALRHIEGEPIGVAWKPQPDGSLVVSDIPAAPPDPLQP